MGNNCQKKELSFLFFFKWLNILILQRNKAEVNQSQALFRWSFHTFKIIVISIKTGVRIHVKYSQN